MNLRDSWNKIHQRFSNAKSLVILGIARPKLLRRDKLGINTGQEKWLLTSMTKICANWLSHTWTFLPPRHHANPLTDLDEI